MFSQSVAPEHRGSAYGLRSHNEQARAAERLAGRDVRYLGSVNASISVSGVHVFSMAIFSAPGTEFVVLSDQGPGTYRSW
jgi:hypothetical protein